MWLNVVEVYPLEKGKVVNRDEKGQIQGKRYPDTLALLEFTP
jgi:hypothetical protein